MTHGRPHVRAQQSPQILRSQLNHIPYLLLKTLDVIREKKKEKYREKKRLSKDVFQHPGLLQGFEIR